MSALRWPGYTEAEIAELLRDAPPVDSNWRCDPQAEAASGVMCLADDRDDDRTAAPAARR
jgi:hypothetical protein